MDGRAIYTVEQVLEVYTLAWGSGMKLREVSAKTGMSINGVSNIKLGYRRADVTDRLLRRYDQLSQEEAYEIGNAYLLSRKLPRDVHRKHFVTLKCLLDIIKAIEAKTHKT